MRRLSTASASKPSRGGRGSRRWVGVLLIALALAALPRCRKTPRLEAPQPPAAIVLTAHDRVLVLAPHPDDEVLGCGGIIQQAMARGLPVRIAFLTYGDNNQWSFTVYRKYPVLLPKAVQGMGRVRHDEALAASKILGVAPEQLTFLGYPDFGTLHLWNDHWDDRPPFRSMLTRVTAVPYESALRPGAAYKGDDVLRDLTAVFRAFKPTKVFVSHPGDQMPDHLALYLFTRVALWDLAAEMQPEVYPYLIHFARWPSPRGFRPVEPLRPPRQFKDGMTWISQPVSPAEVARKREAIAAHRSQYLASRRSLLSFIRPNELFGDFPAIALGHAANSVALFGDHQTPPTESAEQLTDVERAAFVGVETRTVQRDGDDLVLVTDFSRPLGQAVEALVYVFGYRFDFAFAKMPKLHIRIGALDASVYDQGARLPRESVRVSRTAKQITLRIPLSALGDPQRILTSARTYLGEVPLDWVSWRVLELPGTIGSSE